MTSRPAPVLEPDDEANRALLQNAHPPSWTNPRPSGRYNLVVLGGGTAGLVSAVGAAGLGAKVALVERHLLGGDCLNQGCVPSKALIRAADAVAEVRTSNALGVKRTGEFHADFGAAMARMRALRAQIAPNDSAARLAQAGVEVFLGQASFIGRDRVQVEGQTLEFARAVIATGARAAKLSIPGLAEAGFLTNETVFSLTELPKRLAVIGAGPIGCELAQAFRRFGSEVTMLSRGAHLLPREDPDASQIIAAAFAREGIRLELGVELQRVEVVNGAKRVFYGATQTLDADAILVAVGRSPNVDGMGLEQAGVAFDGRGVTVNDRLQTTNERIYAAGDVCSRFQFTHAADALARIAIQNALFFGRKKASALTIPWCTYTSPEVAHVGLYEREAKAQGLSLSTHTVQLSDIDRAILDGQTDGFARIHVDPKGRLRGATVVAKHAGEFIGEPALAVTLGLSASALAQTILPYPTQAEVWKRLGDAHARARLTPRTQVFLEKLLAWRR